MITQKRNGEEVGFRENPSQLTLELSTRLVDGIFDNIETYNIPKFDGFHPRQHPKVLQNNIEEIEKFSRNCHSKVVLPLLELFAILLELSPEATEQLLSSNAYDTNGEDHLRYMHYKARTPEVSSFLQTSVFQVS